MNKKSIIAIIPTLLCSVVNTACVGDSISANDLNSTSLANTYLDFAVIDYESTWPNLSDEEYWANISLNGYSTHSSTNNSSYVPIVLTGNDNFSANMNGGNFTQLVATTYLASEGYYSLHNQESGVTLPNQNSYEIQLQYQSNNYSGVLSNLPYVYTIDSATCQVNNGATICTVNTSKDQSLGANSSLTYVLSTTESTGFYLCGSNSNISTTGSVDTVSFGSSSNCPITSTTTLQLTIGYNVALTNQQNSSESGSINMQGEYDFVSKSIPVGTN